MKSNNEPGWGWVSWQGKAYGLPYQFYLDGTIPCNPPRHYAQSFFRQQDDVIVLPAWVRMEFL